jgi:hypothetical protein
MDSFLGAYERENKIVWGRVDELEAEEKRLKARIAKLETALRVALPVLKATAPDGLAVIVVRQALEEKDD